MKIATANPWIPLALATEINPNQCT